MIEKVLELIPQRKAQNLFVSDESGAKRAFSPSASRGGAEDGSRGWSERAERGYVRGLGIYPNTLPPPQAGNAGVYTYTRAV